MPLPVSYCFDIRKGKNISAVWHGFAVKRRCVRYMETGEDIVSGKMAGERPVRVVKMIRRRFRKFLE